MTPQWVERFLIHGSSSWQPHSGAYRSVGISVTTRSFPQRFVTVGLQLKLSLEGLIPMKVIAFCLPKSPLLLELDAVVDRAKTDRELLFSLGSDCDLPIFIQTEREEFLSIKIFF